MKKPAAVVVICAPFLLASCCLWGYKTEQRLEWESVYGGDAQQIKASCEAQARQQNSSETAALYACYEKNGLRPVERSAIVCKSMHMF